MANVLVVGSTRGLGLALVNYYSAQSSTTVYATARSSPPAESSRSTIKWLTGVDLTKSDCAKSLVSQLDKDTTFTTVFFTAGIFKLESLPLSTSDWDNEIATYVTSAIAPPFIISALLEGKHLATAPKDSDRGGAKIILLSSEAGSLTLNQAGGGGNYSHHASKSAVNMVGTQLRYDLEPHGIAIAMVHPSFMRTQMTKDVGFDVAYEQNEALTPEEAAGNLAKWTDDSFSMALTGQFWAPRGTRDIGSWKDVMGGEHIKEPVQLPW
jgi:NAD(P)-dependent dehydrogenase (short-subunit alcohol dehydrogenase family)